MKFPAREPRNEPHLAKYNYYDTETVVQDDGSIAKFVFENNKREEGWRFSCMVDKHGFWIWDDKDHEKRWDENITIEQLLLESKCSNPSNDTPVKVADDEEIHAYVYGGVLSQRGGWFVVKKNNPNKIIRSKQTWLS